MADAKVKKPRNLIAKDLFTPKYKMRVVVSKKMYNRQLEKRITRENLYADRRTTEAIN